MYVAEVSVNVDEMETFINHELLQETSDSKAGVSCVGNTVTVNTSRTGNPNDWDARKVKRAVQNAIQRMAPGCEIVWKS